VVQPARRRWWPRIGPALLLVAPLLSAASSGILAGTLPAQAVEIAGATYFLKGPWQANLVSYETTVGASPVWYYLTVSLDADAGASLGRLTVEQTRGVDRHFGFNSELTTAFLGLPRRQGRQVPVRAVFDPRTRLISVEFPEPVQPGETVTVVLRPWTNPTQSDTYMFSVVAWPAGANPVASPVGFTTLRIYDRTYF
jgi:hypothetical protein